MNNKQRIIMAEKRINELELLISHWKLKTNSSRKENLKIVKGELSENTLDIAA